ncbi:hypothetical protein BDR26DRAFT_942873 [Obelidium mucronatum]|nr:hypothetical protein BDR26DRAFT_942873 [Obelidium mucronatum]
MVANIPVSIARGLELHFAHLAVSCFNFVCLTHLHVPTTDLNCTLQEAAIFLSNSSFQDKVVFEVNQLLSSKGLAFCHGDDPSNRASDAFKPLRLGFVIYLDVTSSTELELEDLLNTSLDDKSGFLACRPAKAQNSIHAVVMAKDFHVRPGLSLKIKWNSHLAVHHAAVLLTLWMTGINWKSTSFGPLCRMIVEPLVVDMYLEEQADVLTAAEAG